MSKILLDTSILIDFIRRSNKREAILTQLVRTGHKLYVSIITHTEIYSGKSVWEEKEAAREVEELFSGIQVLPLEVEISKRAGEIKVGFESTIVDAIIAATAREHSLSLATLNIKDFKKIKGLRVVDISKTTLM